MSWLDWLPGRHPPRPIDEALWRNALERCPLAARLDGRDRAGLRSLATRFLADKRFHPVDMELNATQQLLIAMQTCIPVRKLGYKALGGWQSVIVYPDRFRVRHDHHDHRTGVVTEHARVLIGEAWHRGPLVLAWAAVEFDLVQSWNGSNVVAHEIAHKLDMLDGSTDGMPPLPRGMARQTWIDTFQPAFDRLGAAVRQGQDIGIDSYAATNPGEYFAVVSELHFSDPGRLQLAEPGVARLLETYYGPSPAP